MEDIHKLSMDIKEFIEIYTHKLKPPIQDRENQIVEADLLWNASYFWACIIHKSTPLREKLTFDEFENYKQQYEKKNNSSINSDILFEKFWLRNVLGFVEIPGGIRCLCSIFEELRNYKNELEFITYLYEFLPNQDKKISKNEFEDKVCEYVQGKNITIDAEKIYQQNWFEIKDDIIDLTNFNHYYSPFLIYWDDFLFISNLKERKTHTHKGLQITQSDFNSIYETFKQLYINIPSIETLINQKVIRKEKDIYYINFHDTKPRYFDLSDKICGFYWELLIKDADYQSDKERLIEYLSKVFYWEGSSDVLRYATKSAKKRFLDTAFDLIQRENDLEGVNNELLKVQLDDYHIHGIYEIAFTRYGEDYQLDNSDLFELYAGIYKIEHEGHYITFLHDQNSREWIFYLLRILVKHDFEVERDVYQEDEDIKTPIERYKRVTQLLKDSKDKPSLLGQIVHNIVYHRREIIPYLLKDSDLLTLSFQIVDEIEFPKEDKNELSIRLWKKCLQLALNTIRSISDCKKSAKIIFQIFRQINKNKYDIAYNRNSNDRDITCRRERENKLLSLIEDSLSNNTYRIRNAKDYLIPHIFNELSTCVIEFKEQNIYNNGVLRLPLLKIDAITWLMKCSTYWKYKSQFTESNIDVLPITKAIYSLYIDTIEKEKIEKYNFFEKKEEEAIPIWGEKQERISLIEWIYPIWFIYKNRQLNKFLEPNFVFENTNEYYNKRNQYTAQTLRIHIGVLLQIHKKLILPHIPYGLKGEDLSKIKKRIEDRILDYLEFHSSNIPGDGKIDIFDYQQEWGFNSSEQEALLPQIADAINYFSDKDRLIDIIIGSNDIIKILTFSDTIKSEGLKKKLIDKIKNIDVEQFLDNSHWIPEIQSTLQKLSGYPELTLQIEKVLSFWEKQVITARNNKHEYQEQLYRTRLLLAYFKEDEVLLNSTPLPDKNGVITIGDISNAEMKDFYRALIRIKSKPSDSYSIFSHLSEKYPKYTNIALNRMAAKINMGENEDNTDFYNEALEEWEEFANANKVDESTLGTTFLMNKMFIYSKMQQYELINTMYQSFDFLIKMQPEILNIQIGALKSQDKFFEASRLEKEAKQFHKITDSGNLDDINSIKEEMIIRELTTYYHEIFGSNPNRLIKIFPDTLNRKKIINEFITNEIALAASKMLDKIMSITEIRSEDKYNDIIELAIDSRIRPWGWNVDAQSRGGFSDTDGSISKQPGERDVIIKEANGNPISVCEAFIYRQKSVAISHIQKIFNYYHQRKNFIILIYNRNEYGTFEDNWKKYFDEIIIETIYPADHKFISKEDVTDSFGWENSGIKIAQSKHETDITIHHIFVNIDYKI
jgi:hypothetical protein